MSMTRHLLPQEAMVLGAAFCVCSVSLRQAPPGAYIPGWEEENFEAFSQRVILATWHEASRLVLKPPKKSGDVPEVITGLFMALSGNDFESFRDMAAAVLLEFFNIEIHSSTAPLARLGSMTDKQLMTYAGLLQGVFSPVLRRFVNDTAEACVRDLFATVNGVEIYAADWAKWHNTVRDLLAKKA